MMNADKLIRSLTPERIVAGVIAAMVVAVTAATAVGFWLSYGGLHDFAVTAGGLTGPEAWAWPASVDLFIVAGEAGVTISALRHRRDRMAWCYLLIGFAASVTGNVLHVHPGYLPWAKYAVAAVPPVAAMLALAALLRHVYRLALDAHLATAPASAPHERWWRRLWMARRTRPAVVAEPGSAEPVEVPAVSPGPATVTVKQARHVTSRAASSRHRNDKLIRLLLSQPDLTEPELASKAGCSVSTVSREKKRLREAAMSNGHGPAARGSGDGA
jgi:Protein of unknown function (DUF2637)